MNPEDIYLHFILPTGNNADIFLVNSEVLLII